MQTLTHTQRLSEEEYDPGQHLKTFEGLVPCSQAPLQCSRNAANHFCNLKQGLKAETLQLPH